MQKLEKCGKVICITAIILLIRCSNAGEKSSRRVTSDMQLVFPAGGNFIAGQNIIVWEKRNHPADKVNIYLSKDSGKTFPTIIAEAIPNNGAFDWDTSGLNGNTFRVKITPIVNESESNEVTVSVSDFVIDNVKPIVLIDPSMSGKIIQNSDSILWETIDENRDTISILLSNDGGQTFKHDIAENSIDQGVHIYNNNSIPDGQNYELRFVAVDKAKNKSEPVDLLWGISVDNTPPNVATTELSFSAIGPSNVMIHWAQSSDIVTASDQLLYRVFYSNTDNLGDTKSILEAGIPASDWLSLGSLTTSENGSIVYSANAIDSSNKYFFNVLVQDGSRHIASYVQNSVLTLAKGTLNVQFGDSDPVDTSGKTKLGYLKLDPSGGFNLPTSDGMELVFDDQGNGWVIGNIGFSGGIIPELDFYLLKFDSGGSIVTDFSIDVFDNPGEGLSRDNYAIDGTLDKSGRLFFTGSAGLLANYFNPNLVVWCISSQGIACGDFGELVDPQQPAGKRKGYLVTNVTARGNAIAISELTGKIYVAGEVKDTSEYFDAAVWCFNTNGDYCWINEYVPFANASDDFTHGISVTHKEIMTSSGPQTIDKIVAAGMIADKMSVVAVIGTKGVGAGYKDVDFGISGVYSFGQGVTSQAEDIIIDKNNNLYVVGSRSLSLDVIDEDLIILGLTPAGEIDPCFGETDHSNPINCKSGFITHNRTKQERGYSITFDQVGNILVMGQTTSDLLSCSGYHFVKRYSNKGIEDSSLGVETTGTIISNMNGCGNNIKVNKFGKIMVVGESSAQLTIWNYR